MVVNEAFAHVLMFPDELCRVNFEVILLHNVESRPNTRQDDDGKDNCIPTFRQPFMIFIFFLNGWKFE